MPEPIIVPRDETTFSAICDQCVRDRNEPWRSGRAPWGRDEHGRDEGYEDVTVSGELPLDQDEAWVTCPYGHRHLVLREGSQRARNFGYASNRLTPKDEARIAEIEGWFHERGYDLVVHEVAGWWRAPYMPRGTWVGSASYGVGTSAVEAAEDAQARHGGGRSIQVADDATTTEHADVVKTPDEREPHTVHPQGIQSEEAFGTPSIEIPDLEQAVERLTGYGWRVWFEEEPGGGVTGYLQDYKSGEVLKVATGTDHDDAYLALAIDTLPPSQEVRREQQP